MSDRSTRAAFVLAVLAIARATPVQAQATDFTGNGRYLSQGALLPPTSITSEQSPFALSLNPAGLAFQSTGLAYLHEDGTKAEEGSRRSDAFYLRFGGLNAGENFAVAAGFSMEWVRPAGGGCSTICERRTSLGLAFGTPMLSVGAAYRWYNSGQESALDDLGTFDLGLTFRPTSWLSAAAEVNAFDAPYLSGTPLPRIYTVGVGVRPFARVLTLAVDYSVDDHTGWRGSKLAYLADLHLPHGLDVLAQLAHEAEEPPGGRHFALEVGLRAEFGYGGLWLAAADQLTNESGGIGGVIAADIHMARAESLFTPDGKAELLDLQHELARPTGIVALLGISPPLDRFTALQLHLDRVAEDGSLDTLIVEVRGLDGLSLGRVEELRARFRQLRAHGRRVIVWLESGGDTEYYLATAADRIYVAPEALIEINGLSTTHMFLRGLLDKLGVEPEFVKQGAYKSAPEEFTNTTSSPAAAEETNALLDDRYERYLKAIAEARHLDVEQVRKLLSEGVFTVGDAVKSGLIDGLSAGGLALEEPASNLAGRKLRLEEAEWPAEEPRQWGDPPAIAIIEVIGDIGASPLDVLGTAPSTEHIIKRLRAAASDSSVKAIVLRVDSPGGDVGASELIYQAVLDAKKHKPVIASFGDVAASGGYYIASAANAIIAEPSTITGSIGVFAGKADLSKLLDKVGVTTETFKRGEHADLMTLTRLWTADERKIVEAEVASFYETFLLHVAEGRHLTRDQVHAIAQGRVWTGAQAKDRGLVDQLGGLEDALREARRLGGLRPNARIVVEGARGVFAFPDVSGMLERIQGNGQPALPALLVALHELLGSRAERVALDQAWPALQGLVLGKPLALMVDPPLVR